MNLQQRYILGWIGTLCLLAGCGLPDVPECREGQTICEPSGSGAIYMYCEDGKFVNHGCTACDGNACADQKNACEANDPPSCVNDAESGIGTLWVCSNGRKTPQLCSGNAACRDEKSCDEASPEPEDCETENAQKCMDVIESGKAVGMMYTCTDGKWQEDKRCSTLCDGNACRITCLDDPSICKHNEICVDGECQKDISCTDENAQKCTDEIESGKAVGVMYICSDGEWQEDKRCSSLCDGNACRITCLDDPSICKHNEICVEGECQKDISCTDENAKKCMDEIESGKAVGVVYTCHDGEWQEATRCPTICDGNACRKTCTEDPSICNRNETCVDGECKEKSYKDCSKDPKVCTGEDYCIKGKCKPLEEVNCTELTSIQSNTKSFCEAALADNNCEAILTELEGLYHALFEDITSASDSSLYEIAIKLMALCENTWIKDLGYTSEQHATIKNHTNTCMQ